MLWEVFVKPVVFKLGVKNKGMIGDERKTV